MRWDIPGIGRRVTGALSRMGRRTRWTLAIVAAALAIVVLLSFLVDEPLRRSLEAQMNARLTGYSVSVGTLRFHPIGLSLTLFKAILPGFDQQVRGQSGRGSPAR